MEPALTIRPFSGSLADAEGLLTVERATFNESPYSAVEIQGMLSEGPQRAWLAVQREHVAGFAIGFPVTGLRGSWWEVDLLAVHPEWRGHRLGHRLIEAALAYGTDIARRARALVADDNSASQQAFLRAGFRAAPGERELLIFRPGEVPRRQRVRWSGRVRESSGQSDVAGFLASFSKQATVALPDSWGTMGETGEPCGKGLVVLVAEPIKRDDGRPRPAGYAELIQVQTLLYRGVWIEALLAASSGARGALVARAVDWAREAGMDEVGAVVHEQDGTLRTALRSAGFSSLGGFRWMVAEMPEVSAQS